jgi:hypothetical protein
VAEAIAVKEEDITNIVINQIESSALLENDKLICV